MPPGLLCSLSAAKAGTGPCIPGSPSPAGTGPGLCQVTPPKGASLSKEPLLLTFIPTSYREAARSVQFRSRWMTRWLSNGFRQLSWNHLSVLFFVSNSYLKLFLSLFSSIPFLPQRKQYMFVFYLTIIHSLVLLTLTHHLPPMNCPPSPWRHPPLPPYGPIKRPPTKNLAFVPDTQLKAIHLKITHALLCLRFGDLLGHLVLLNLPSCNSFCPWLPRRLTVFSLSLSPVAHCLSLSSIYFPPPNLLSALLLF